MDFLDRDVELRLLDAKVRGGTHVLLADQRRMGKTSVAKELGDHHIPLGERAGGRQ